MNIAETFKGRAAERRVSHDEIAGVLGIHRQSVYRKLNGITPFTLGEAWLVADHLGLKLADLVKRQPEDG